MHYISRHWKLGRYTLYFWTDGVVFSNLCLTDLKYSESQFHRIFFLTRYSQIGMLGKKHFHVLNYIKAILPSLEIKVAFFQLISSSNVFLQFDRYENSLPVFFWFHISVPGIFYKCFFRHITDLKPHMFSFSKHFMQ